LRFFEKDQKTLQKKTKRRILFLYKKNKTTDLKKHEGWIFKKWVFLNPDYLSILFCDFPLIARSGTSHVTISLIGCAPYS